MDILISVGGLRKCVLFTQLVRQHLRQLISAGVKSLPDCVHYKLLRKSGRQPVHGDYPAGHSVRGVFRLVNGIGHSTLCTDADNFAVKIQALATVYVVFEIRLIKISYVNRTAFVRNPKLHKLHAAADAHKSRRVCNDALNAGGLTVTGERNGFKPTAILVFSREIRNKVMDGKDAELV